MFTDKNARDTIVRQQATIDQLTKTIDKLTDKVIAISNPQAIPVYDKTEETPKSMAEEDPTTDLQDASEEDTLEALNARKP